MITNINTDMSNMISTESNCMKDPIWFKGTSVVILFADAFEETGSVKTWPVNSNEGDITITLDKDGSDITVNTFQVTRIY